MPDNPHNEICDRIDVPLVAVLDFAERKNLARIYAVLASDLVAMMQTGRTESAFVVAFHAHVAQDRGAYAWIDSNLASLQAIDDKITLPDKEEWNDHHLDDVFRNFFYYHHELRLASPFEPITGEVAW